MSQPALYQQVRRAATRSLRIAQQVRLVADRDRPRFECPLCGYTGIFIDRSDAGLRRYHAQCPRCGSLERHRMQWFVINELVARDDAPFGRCLQFAPDPMTRVLEEKCQSVTTADLDGYKADLMLDIRDIAFEDESVDVVFASHVLEHIDRDREAIREIHRILRPGGMAILPVPIVAAETVEYGAPSAAEEMHVRAPGPDYIERYREVFDRVDLWTSDDAPERFQTWVRADYSIYPTDKAPLRPPLDGQQHADVVPVCFKRRPS